MKLAKSNVYRKPKVKLSPTKTLTGKPLSTKIADFSSRGPSDLSPAILKVMFTYIHTYIHIVMCMGTKVQIPVIDNQATHKKRENHTTDLRGSTKCLCPQRKRIHSLYYSTLWSNVTNYIIFIISAFLAPKKALV